MIFNVLLIFIKYLYLYLIVRDSTNDSLVELVTQYLDWVDDRAKFNYFVLDNSRRRFNQAELQDP